ncbi:hypothetical protein D6D29_05919 [Aureobasidium pullulans]|nr:hypothetical protein D6D29_05919 [Aureobasidium pullulans]
MASTSDVPSDETLLETTKTEQSRLLKVPNEIIGLIASVCDPDDLKNLRLTSKFMCNIASPAFGRKAFSRRRFIFTRKSMQGLLNITAHPVFGPCLRVITFGTCCLRDYDYGEDEAIDSSLQYNIHMDDVSQASFQIKELEHKAFVQKGGHIEMLTLALRNLQACSNHGVILGAHDDSLRYMVKRRAYGFNDAYGKFIPTKFNGVETLDAIFAASSHSQYPIQAMKLFVSQEHLSTLLETSENLLQIFHDETNGPALNPDMDFHIGIRIDTTYAKMKILSAGTRLELSCHSFEVGADGKPYLRYCEYNYGLIWRAIERSPLQDILIEKSDVEYGSLTEFLEGQAESLDNLVLRNVHMVCFNSSPTEQTVRLLRFLKDDLWLESLTLEGLTVGQGIVLPESGKVVFEGREDVIKGLEELIVEVEVMYEDEPESSDEDDLMSSDSI